MSTEAAAAGPAPASEAAPAAAAGPADARTKRPGMRADARRNYERLLAEAAAAFAERGTDEVSLEEIARRSGVGIGTLYRHFPTRQALLEAVYRDQVEVLGARAAELARADSPADALAEWMTAIVRFGRAKRGLTTALLEVMDRDSELLSASREVLHGATDVLVERAKQAGAVSEDVRGSDVLRLVHGVSMAADMGADPGQADRMLALVLGGLLAPAGRAAAR